MAIRMKGTKHQVDVTVKGVRAPRVSCDTLGEARAVEARFKAHLMEGRDPAELASNAPLSATSQATLAQAVEAAISDHWRGKKSERDSTRCAYAWCEALGYDFPVLRLGTMEVSRVIDEWAENGAAGGTINRKVAALSRMLESAEDRGWVDRKIKLKRKAEYEGRLRYYTNDEVNSLIDYAEGDAQIRDLIILAVETGMRQGELLALTKRDFNFERGIIELQATKGNKRRSVPLTERAKAVCTRLCLNGLFDHEKVFEDRINQRRISRWIRGWKAERGMPADDEACFHTLRHTTCSRLVQAGVPIVVVQNWMGHQSIATTMKYAHLAPDSLDVALVALNERKSS